MNTNRYLKNYSYRAITPHFERRISYQSDGVPARRIKTKVDIVQTNSPTYSASLPQVNPNQLELDLAAGVKLKKVSPTVLSPDNYQAEIAFEEKKDDSTNVIKTE